jgi:hypothetical protein
MPGDDILVANNFPTYFFFNLFLKHSQYQLKCFAATIMATKISNMMVEIQVTKNIVLLFATPSLKNVATSSVNEEEEK